MIIIWDSDERFLSQNIENKINESGVLHGESAIKVFKSTRFKTISW